MSIKFDCNTSKDDQLSEQKQGRGFLVNLGFIFSGS